MEQTKALQDLIDKVLEITYGYHGAQYRKHLIETDAERYYILKASGELYDHIAEKNREGVRAEQAKDVPKLLNQTRDKSEQKE